MEDFDNGYAKRGAGMSNKNPSPDHKEWRHRASMFSLTLWQELEWLKIAATESLCPHTRLGAKANAEKISRILNSYSDDSAKDYSLSSQVMRLSAMNERFYRAMKALTTQTGHLPHKGECTPECEEIRASLNLWKGE